MSSSVAENFRLAQLRKHSSPPQSPAVGDQGAPLRHSSPANDFQEPEDCRIPSRQYTSVPAEEPRNSSTIADLEDDDTDGLRQCRSYNEPLGKLETLSAWLFEALSMLVSISAFFAIIVLLFLYDKKPQPEFAYSLRISTFVAIFTTIIRATLVFTLAGVIGQSKWIWMKSPRPLRDIEVFDNAGRGAWGSLKFLFFSWKPTLTILSAFVILTSYAVGPFSQQAVKTYSCEISAEGAANIQTAEWVNQAEVNPTEATDTIIWLSPEMRTSMINGLIQGPSNSPSGLSQCGSNNCTFETISGITHQSVGICSRCINIRDQLVEKNVTFSGMQFRAFQAPDSAIEVDRTPEPQILGMSTIQGSISKTRPMDFESGTVDTTIVSFTASNCTTQRHEDGTETRRCDHDYKNMPGLDQKLDIVAAKCNLYPCLRKYHGQISNGILNETLVEADPMRRALNFSVKGEKKEGYISVAEPFLVQNSWYDASNISQVSRSETNWTSWTTGGGTQDAPSECVRFMEYEAFMGIEQFVSDRFSGSCKAYHGAAKKMTSAVFDSPMILGCGDEWVEILHRGGMSSLATLSTAFENMATAATNRMRLNGENWARTGRSSVPGRGTQSTICIRVEWPWLFYPGALLLIALGLLGATYLRSCHDRTTQPVWKSAILPLIFYDLVPERKRIESEIDGRGSGARLLQLKQLEKLADRTIVKF